MKANFLGATVLAGGALAGVTSEPKPVSSRPPQSTIQPTLSSIYAAAATAVPQSPVSNVAGKAFDRIIQIWLENTDYNVSLTRVTGAEYSCYYAPGTKKNTGRCR
jgi:acid phosphatase